MWRGTNHDGISREPGWLVTWPKDGPKELWRASIGTGFATVSVSQGRLFTGGNSNQTDTVYCLDSETGREVWKHSYACPVNIPQERFGPAATPTLDRDRVYTLSLEGHVFCFEAASGKILWSKQIAQELNARPPRWGFSGSPLAQGGLLILNVGSAGTALDKATGKVVWTSGRGPAGYASPVPFSNEGQPAVGIFAADALIALNPATGKELWRHAWKTDYGINVADPVFVGDKAFVASNYGKGCGLIQFHGSEAKLLRTNNNLHAHFSSP